MLLSSRTIPAEVHGNGRFVIPARNFTPVYLKTYEEGRLKAKVEEALEALRCCTLCPRDCRIDRLANKFAVCKSGRYAKVSSYFHHFGEEDALRGWRGSGTIFFSWCNLRCVFCFSPEMLVLTDRGPMRIQDIFDKGLDELSMNGGSVRQIQDLRAYTRKGTLAPILKVFRHPHEGELVAITAEGMPSVLATPDHEVFAATSPGGVIGKVPAGALTQAHLLLKPRLHAKYVSRIGIHEPFQKSLAPLRTSPQRYSKLETLERTDTAEISWTRIQNIARVRYRGPVYNLEMADEDHSYTVHGIAVSNCQNFETSQIGEGEEVSPQDLARMMLQLQEEGCHNINFVTPEHVVAQILEALLIAVEGGLRLPLVYNTSSYDSAHSIQLMDGVVDIYMPDFKLWDRERSRRYLLAPDYPEAARTVVRAMHEQVGELLVNEDGLALRGVIVRHLVMPGMLEDTREIMRFLAGLSTDTYVNVMDQYYPAYRAKTEEKFRDINRRVFRQELNEAYAHARDAGLWRFDTRWRRVPASAWT